MNCYATPAILRMVDSEKAEDSFLTHIHSCPSCAHAYFSLIFSLSAMKHPDSPLFKDIPEPSASISLTRFGFTVNHAIGFSLASPVPVRGKRKSTASLVSGPVVLEPVDSRTFRIAISCVHRSCTLSHDTTVVYRTGRRNDRFSISGLNTGSYRLTVDDTVFSFSVE